MTGPLQLAEGTHLTLDETVLQAGALSPVGVQNLESLKHLLQWQKVRYTATAISVDLVTGVSMKDMNMPSVGHHTCGSFYELRQVNQCAPMTSQMG